VRDMANDSRKRSKHTPSNGKKQVTAAKRSAKKKRKQGLKYRNADLRTALDSQTQEMFEMTARRNKPQPLGSSEEALNALERTMQNL